ncbi:MFS transporter [Viridibacillus sp. FSL R5-0477]|uniref:Major facilitator (MFS) superfamily protein n=1 Tax=Viridibacillus arenosi FSL R5-213 TaxID=1227360 RepID=W4F1I7_9BACL|nr:MFS transporter [Viridibacillus arenosi]ETT86635.1 major facilitator (MFS) superfamily protein [Viridibacillus arenosi FSL R5-213]OMC89590.1 MFS transporter [Viridibacillus arenosi]
MNSYTKWLIVLVATLSQTAATFVTYGMGPIATFYQIEWNLSALQTGFIVSAVNIGPIFSMIIFGYLMDKKGEKQIIGWGSILLGLSALTLIFVNNYIILLLLLLLVGIWYGSAQTGGSTAIVKWFPDKHRGLALGIRQTGIPIGGALASVLLTYTYYHYELSAVHIVQGIFAIAGGLLFLVAYHEPKENIATASKSVSFKEKMNTIKNNKALYPIYIVGIVMMSLQMIIIAHFMSYLHIEGNYSLTQAGEYLSLILIGGMVGRVAIAWVSDQFFEQNREKLLFIVMVVTVVLTVILPLVINAKLVMLLFCFLLGFVAIGWYSLFIACITEQSDPRYIGLTVSSALTLNQVFIVIAPSLFGLIVNILNSYQIALYIAGIIVALGAINLYITKVRVA